MKTYTKTTSSIDIQLAIATAVLLGVSALAFAIIPAMQKPKKTVETATKPQPVATQPAEIPADGIGRGFANPAAVHCKELGYSYEIRENENGQYGVCIFPDKVECEEWKFLQGYCGKEHSYCAQKGYDLKIKTDGKNPFSREYAVCVDKKGQEVGSVVDLMDLYKKSATSCNLDKTCSKFPCGKGKAFVCSKPGSAAEKTLCVAEEAVKALLDQGGYCGPCGEVNNISKTEPSVSMQTESIDKQIQAALLSHTAQAQTVEMTTLGDSGSLPTSFDWRDYNGANWMTSVKNQGSCGSCWAFGTVGATEAVANIDANNPDLDLDLSEEYLVSDCSNAGNCCGGWSGGALTFIKDFGIPDEACMPYIDGSGCMCGNSCKPDSTTCNYRANNSCSDATCSDRCANWQSRVVKINQWLSLPPDSAIIKQYLINYGPLSVTFSWDLNGTFDSNGIFRCSFDPPMANHAVVLVGYNDEKGYWILKNSWGADAGSHDNGYLKIDYGSCGMEFGAIVVMKSKSITPQTISISDCEELQAINNFPIHNNYVLTNDIDCSDTVNWNNGAGFEPIGTEGTPFSGTFDGQNHIIKGLYVNRPDSNFKKPIGLFGKTSAYGLGGRVIIKNVGLEDVDITGDTYAGGIVGKNDADISNSYATGDVNCNQYCGGLLGENQYEGQISNSYSRVFVKSTSLTPTIGGLAGMNFGLISNSYVAGKIEATPDWFNVAGVVAGGLPESCQNSFWDTEISGISRDICPSGTTGKTTAEMKSIETFTSLATAGLTTPWDFVSNPYDDNANENIWDIRDSINNGYPYFSQGDLKCGDSNCDGVPGGLCGCPAICYQSADLKLTGNDGREYQVVAAGILENDPLTVNVPTDSDGGAVSNHRGTLNMAVDGCGKMDQTDSCIGNILTEGALGSSLLNKANIGQIIRLMISLQTAYKADTPLRSELIQSKCLDENNCDFFRDHVGLLLGIATKSDKIINKTAPDLGICELGRAVWLNDCKSNADCRPIGDQLICKLDPEGNMREYTRTITQSICQSKKCAETSIDSMGQICRECSDVSTHKCSQTQGASCGDLYDGEEWNGDSSYTQTWNGSEWLPVYVKNYNATTAGSCNFKCKMNYEYNASAKKCEALTRTISCGALNTGQQWNGESSYTQAWSGTKWQPVYVKNYNLSMGTCNFLCAPGYGMNTVSGQCQCSRTATAVTLNPAISETGNRLIRSKDSSSIIIGRTAAQIVADCNQNTVLTQLALKLNGTLIGSEPGQIGDNTVEVKIYKDSVAPENLMGTGYFPNVTYGGSDFSYINLTANNGLTVGSPLNILVVADVRDTDFLSPCCARTLRTYIYSWGASNGQENRGYTGEYLIGNLTFR